MTLFGVELPDAEAVIPTEFYDVRSETTPKAGWIPMYSFTAVIYISAVIAFVLLYQNEARKSTTETIILPYDFSGNDGYTCQMISRVTGTYQIPSSLDPSLAYNLANIMESKSQCESDLQVANPCGTPMVYFPGTASSFGAPGTAYGAAAIFHEHVVYMFDTSDAEITINSYDYSTGTYFSGEFYPVPVPITTSLAVNKFGSPIYLSRSLNSSTVQVRQADPADISLAEFENGSPNTIILNDNLYNIYVAVNNTFIYVNIYAHPVVSTVIFSLAEGDNILHAAVHHDGSSPTVFFYSTLGAPTHTYYQYKDNSITAYDEILPPNYIVSGLVTDGDYVYFCEASTIRENTYYVLRYAPGEPYYENVLITTLLSTRVPPAFVISPSGSRVFTVQRSTALVEAWTMVYVDEGHYTDAEPVLQMQGFGAEYFACGDKLLTSDDYSPGVVAEYPQACENNGLVGKVIFSKRSYFLTSSDSQAYALNHSASSCAALASPMCNTVSALPPYSCSRTLKQGFFSCAATAVANAQFLVQVLVFACAFMLPKLAKVFPATTRAAIDGASTVSAAAVASSSSVLAQAAQITSTASADPAGLSPAAAEHSMSGASTVNNTADAYLEMAVMGQVRYDVENPLNSV